MNPTPVSSPLPFKMACTGLGLNSPVDSMTPGKFPILKNVRVLQNGQLDNRAGSAVLTTGIPAPIHSIRRLNDKELGIYTRLVGAGPSIYAGTNVFAPIDTGYSGNPLSLVPFRPTNSISPWMYVADSLRMRKILANGVNYLMGITPPSSAPLSGLADPYLDIIADFGSGEHFAASGTASSVTNPPRFNDTAAIIAYDAGTNAWCTVIPTGGVNGNYQPGALISLTQGGNNDEDPIHDVFPAITATTVTAIIYDSGTIGACSVTLAAPSSGLVPYALIQIGSEIVKVLSVINGVDGVPSIRCVTGNTHAVGAAVSGFATFRVYTNLSYTAGATIGGSITAVQVTAGIGIITAALSENLAVIGGTQPTSPSDLIHASLLFDVPANVTQGWLEIDTSDGLFDQNYYSYNFSANQLAPALTGASTVSTAQQVTVQQSLVNDAATQILNGNGQLTDSTDTVGYTLTPTGASPNQSIVLGGNQWTELFFTVNDLIPVGSSQIASLATVVAVRVRLQVTGTVNMFASSWWVGGGFGPEIGQVGSPALYVYRYRASATGALSNPSPYTLTGLQPNRERIIVTVQGSVDAQVDNIDIFRFGVGLDQWTYLGSVPNSLGSHTFFDVYDALSITGNEIAEFDNYVPFPVDGPPQSGFCNTSGISVQWVGGATFNTQWVAGTQIVINGVPYELYGNPTSTTRLQIAESAGAHNNVAYTISNPTIAGQPLPFMWGYGGQGIGTFMFGVGDAFNPGFLRWTKGNNPDTASDTGNLEITSPSEPLINGFEYDSRNFVFSSERLFSILPNLSGGTGSNSFTAQVVLTGKGLYAPYSICITPLGIAWVGTDGIYAWNGISPVCITDADLYPLFPHGGTPGVSVNGYYPPDYTQPNAMRLGYSSSSIYFSYIDTQGNPQLLRYDLRLNGWFPEQYPAPATLIYQEEGQEVDSTLLATNTGSLYQIGLGNTALDGATPFTCQIRTPAFDGGVTRAQKLYTDFMLDVNPQSSAFTPTLYFNNFTSSQSAGTVTGNARTQYPLPTNPTSISLYRNIALDLQWTGPGTVYEFQPWAINQPHLSLEHFAQSVNFGNYTHMRDGWIGYISTAAVTIIITLDNVAYPYVLPSSNGIYIRVYRVFGPYKGLLIGFAATSPSPFVLFAGDTIINLKPWGTDSPYTQYKPFQGMIEA